MLLQGPEELIRTEPQIATSSGRSRVLLCANASYIGCKNVLNIDNYIAVFIKNQAKGWFFWCLGMILYVVRYFDNVEKQRLIQ